jgi:hypothetical protein
MENETKVLEGDALINFFNKAEGVEEKVENTESLQNYFEEKKEIKEEVITNTTPDKITTEAPAAPKTVEPKTSIYTDLIKEYIEDGDWEDGAIEMEDENGEVVQVNLLELKDVTPAQFKQIKAGQKALKEEELKSKYISKENLDENTLKIIELKKAGGDTRELFQIQAEIVNPLDTLDLDDERVHEYLVRQKLSANPDLDQEDIDNKIAKMKTNFILDTEAKKIITEVNTNFGLAIEQKKKEHAEATERIIGDQKEFKKSMTQTFKELKLNDNLVKRLVEDTAKFDELGLTNVDKAFFEAKKNPQLFAKISYLILDEKGFNEFQGVKIKNDVTKDTIKTIFKISPKITTTNIKEEEGDLKTYFEKNK